MTSWRYWFEWMQINDLIFIRHTLFVLEIKLMSENEYVGEGWRHDLLNIDGGDTFQFSPCDPSCDWTWYPCL